MFNAVQWLVPTVRKVSSGVANVPDALISFPHLNNFPLFKMALV